MKLPRAKQERLPIWRALVVKVTNQKRTECERRRILDIALLDHIMETGESPEDFNHCEQIRDAFLEGDEDRALYGLLPRTR